MLGVKLLLITIKGKRIAPQSHCSLGYITTSCKLQCQLIASFVTLPLSFSPSFPYLS